MASSIFHTLSLILFHFLFAAFASSARTPTPTKQSGFRATLTRVHPGQALPKYTLDNDPSSSLIKSQMKAYKDEYTMSLAIGTPPVPFSAIMDTGSNLIWIEDSSFDTSKSTSFSNVNKSCTDVGLDQDCIQRYDDGKVSVRVTLGQETLSIGDKMNTIKNVTFGCGESNDTNNISSGVVGMGPGKLSLVSHLDKRVFSYCLGSRFDPKASSVLLAGSEANIRNGNVKTTQLDMDESNYYITLEGISIGKTKLPVTIASNGSPEGMVIDSGSTFTYLEKSIIDMISNEFMNQTNLEKSNDIALYEGLEHCFMYQGYNKDQAPKLVFHFEGADWELPRENYIYEREDGQGGCLAFMASEKSDDNQSIFGNMMQQNMMVIYNLEKTSLSFYRPPNCNML